MLMLLPARAIVGEAA